MVCEKCQKKTSRVICPEVNKKPLFKRGSDHPDEESKEPVKAKSVRDDEIDFGAVTTSKLDESSKSGLQSKDERLKSGQSML
jgi:hypothetical protein